MLFFPFPCLLKIVFVLAISGGIRAYAWLLSGILSGSAWGGHHVFGMPGIKNGSAMCKANALLTVLSLQSPLSL